MSIRPLTPDLQRKAEKELNEVPTQIKENIAHIRKWVTDQPHLKARTEDQWLLNFLRGCKFNHERTKQKLDAFYTSRTRIPEFFAERDPFSSEIQELLKLGIFLPLQRTSDLTAPRLLLIRSTLVDPNKIHIMSVMKVIIMILDILINEEDDFIITGLECIVDLKGLTLTQILQMTPSNSKKIFWCFQDAYPIRPQKVYFLNSRSYFEHLFGVIKFFMSDKIKNRLSVVSETQANNLYDFVPRSVLPQEYGGEYDSVVDMTAEWKKKVESYQNWYFEDAQYCTDESKRPKERKESLWSRWSSIFRG